MTDFAQSLLTAGSFQTFRMLTLCPSVLSELKKRYDVTVIPKLVVIKPNGAVITNKGRKQIRECGLACFQNWVEAADVFQNFLG